MCVGCMYVWIALIPYDLTTVAIHGCGVWLWGMVRGMVRGMAVGYGEGYGEGYGKGPYGEST